MAGGGPLNTDTVPRRSSTIAIDIGDFRPQQSVRLHPDLVGGAVIDMQRARAAADIDAERLPGKGLLEDALAQVAGEEQAVGALAAQRGEKAQLRDADILRFIDHDVFEGRMLPLPDSPARRLNMPARVMAPCAARRARTAAKIDQRAMARCASGKRVFLPRRFTSR